LTTCFGGNGDKAALARFASSAYIIRDDDDDDDDDDEDDDDDDDDDGLRPLPSRERQVGLPGMRGERGAFLSRVIQAATYIYGL